MRSRARGFTLIEVMIAVAITAIIGGMLVGAFQRAAVAKELVEADDERIDGARLALTRMAREISMAFLSEHYDHKRYRERPTLFRGRDQGGRGTLVFTTFAHARLERDAKESDAAVIEYRLESDAERSGEYVLTRREKVHVDDDPDRGGTSAALCDHVTGLELQYWDWKRQEWVREWSSSSVERQGQLPTRVHLKLTLKMPDGKERPFTTETRVAIVRPLDF
jgi:general secretion pathway protein J